MKRIQVLFVITLIVSGCVSASIDKSKLTTKESELITFINTMINDVSGKIDAKLRGLMNNERLVDQGFFSVYTTSFGSTGGAQVVHNYLGGYCEQKGGKMMYGGCVLGADEQKVLYHYRLLTSYNKYSRSNTDMNLRILIPKVVGDPNYLDFITRNGYKTKAIIAREEKQQQARQLAREQELMAMRKTGTKVCGPTWVDVGWVEDYVNGKLKIRIHSNRKIVWDKVENWKICE